MRDRKDRQIDPFFYKIGKNDQIDQNKRVWRLENPYQPRRRKVTNAQDVLERYSKGKKVEDDA